MSQSATQNPGCPIPAFFAGAGKGIIPETGILPAPANFSFDLVSRLSHAGSALLIFDNPGTSRPACKIFPTKDLASRDGATGTGWSGFSCDFGENREI
jgi:hypothetical protein